MFSPLSLKPLILLTGHYGVGKTNLAINFALDLRKAGQEVSLVDLDVVNPYFRTSEYAELLEEAGVAVVSPTFAGTTLDNPALSPAIAGAFEKQEGFIIIDVGGDDVGATALGRFRGLIQSREHDLLYVVNRYRNLTPAPADALDILYEIEAATGLKATGIVNNTHLQLETSCETVRGNEMFGSICSHEAGLPLVCVSVPAGIECEGLDTPEGKRYPTEIYVKPPWQ